MSLHRDPIGPIPTETVRIAQAAFPKGTLFIRLRDTLRTIYTDQVFVDLFSQVIRDTLANMWQIGQRRREVGYRRP